MLKAGRAADAEHAYREDLTHWPENRFALEGLRTALNAHGRMDEAEALGARVDNARKHISSTEREQRRAHCTMEDMGLKRLARYSGLRPVDTSATRINVQSSTKGAVQYRALFPPMKNKR